MKRWFLDEPRAFIPALLLLVWLGTTVAWGEVAAQTAPNATPSIERNGDPSNPESNSAPTPPPKSQIHGWFNRSGAGLLLSLTPFATGVTLLILLLILLSPLLIRALTRERGYFRAVPYTRQRRFS
ncbi:MAG: hypothetical protein HY282_11505 [Nitrospirae bacterium]|nr:hypothetical protein [Candidatus Manganitrophaceae bacterium]